MATSIRTRTPARQEPSVDSHQPDVTVAVTSLGPAPVAQPLSAGPAEQVAGPVSQADRAGSDGTLDGGAAPG